MDKFVEVTSESWFSRISGAIKGVAFGGVLFLVSFPVLYHNEGRAVETYKALQEGAGRVKSVPITKISSANEGKLVHVFGEVKNAQVLRDESLGIQRQGLRLSREVSIYQWKEVKKTKTSKNIGGTKETVTEYSYERGWDSRHIDSGRFKNVAGHENPTPRLRSRDVVAERATLGAFIIPTEILVQIGTFKPFMPEKIPDAMKKALAGRTITKAGDSLYVGNDPDNPAIGDLKIQFGYVPDSPATIVAAQLGNSFGKYQTSSGREIQLVEDGRVAPKAMFSRAETRNSILTWVLRGVGFLLMTLGLILILQPLAVIADVLPILGSIVATGARGAAGLLSLFLSSITIAVSWFIHRPMLSIGLLAVAAVVLYLLNQRRAKGTKRLNQKPPMPNTKAA